MKIYLLIPLLLFFSCKTTITKKNSDEDIKKAEELARQFYQFYDKNELDSLVLFFDVGNYADPLRNTLNSTKSSIGEIRSIDIEQRETINRKTENTEIIEYNIWIKGIYERGTTNEDMKLILEKGKIKFSGYTVTIHK